MIGVQFDAVNGVDGIDIQDLISNPADVLPGATAPNVEGGAAQLWYWDPNEPGKYATLYLNNKVGDATHYGKWCVGMTVASDTSWGEKRNDVSHKKLVSGMGLWLVRPSGTYGEPITLTMSGAAVKAESGRTYNLHSGYNMIAGGFTTGFAPNPDVAGTGSAFNWITEAGLTGASAPNVEGAADQIWFWDPNEPGKYATLYLNNKSTDATRYGKWCVGMQVPTDTTWGEKRNDPSPKVIPMGRGFWIVRPEGAGAISFTLPQPYSL